MGSYTLEASNVCTGNILTIAAITLLSGCAASWIASPSPATENLVHDLKLEGFECSAGLSAVTCRQAEPYVERSGKRCTADEGCVKQPCYDVRIVYEIRQGPSKMPAIVQTTERTVTKEIRPNPVNSGERIKLLEEYCLLPSAS